VGGLGFLSSELLIVFNIKLGFKVRTFKTPWLMGYWYWGIVIKSLCSCYNENWLLFKFEQFNNTWLIVGRIFWLDDAWFEYSFSFCKIFYCGTLFSLCFFDSKVFYLTMETSFNGKASEWCHRAVELKQKNIVLSEIKLAPRDLDYCWGKTSRFWKIF
jgi:hypothetical protein